PGGSWQNVAVTEAPGVLRPLLGKEAYKEVPGDLRQQFVGVIDRNNLTVTSTTGSAVVTDGSYTKVGPRPFFTTLEAPVLPSPTPTITLAAATDPATGLPAIFSDGVPLPLQTGTKLVIGDGADQEVVEVLMPGPPAPLPPVAIGVITVALS